ncbi:ketopantoate hydroxymethyltransferase [Piptocephalis cylindrospora]|uniref:3-methyl-2-oxobutanoate hydroxymethyltransferase n=1 Tax=Piptocephalis cylindrospora TaxID=1907219 RepID=A0A4V1IYH5_9FUNG|nr:ketopantoate hydroxymethyltransferase [Piptocephalis cylindrospora]|eukprot:RKP14579.1 ketopantoate hydroxymethyltransferase [Piptocephalis cylindrospora]
MLTAYDYPTGLIVDRAGMDLCLVGDSLGMVCLGYDSTTSVTMEDMIHHCSATSRGAQKAFLIGDLPFGAYQASTEQAIRNACRLMQEGNVESIKLEGGRVYKERISAMTGAGIPVMGHIGLTPQSQAALGGYRVQGKTASQAMHLLEDALALQDAGCWSIVLEAVPAPVAKAVTDRLSIPTIGIGAGQECSGQVLVMMDMLGIFDKFLPRFCKQYAQLSVEMARAVEQYGKEVTAGSFPGPEHCYPMPAKEEDAFHEALSQWDQRQV